MAQRLARVYFKRPVDIKDVSAMVKQDFGYNSNVEIKDTGSDKVGFYATLVVSDPTISNNVLAMIGTKANPVVDVVSLKKESEPAEEPLAEDTPPVEEAASLEIPNEQIYTLTSDEPAFMYLKKYLLKSGLSITEALNAIYILGSVTARFLDLKKNMDQFGSADIRKLKNLIDNAFFKLFGSQ